ncbi:MAG: response regulator [Candidatus Hydrogenedentes bacterium]|nr:response regulator [Candidatus Hydrogenedentota bacterium]
MNPSFNTSEALADTRTAVPDNGNELVLIVDDVSANRERLADEIELLGYQYAEAGNGVQALEQLETLTPDLILLDLMMPVLDGHGVLDAMHAHPEWRRIPVVVVSGMDDLDSVVKCLEKGAADYLVKPIKSRLLRARIENTLAGNRLRKRDELLRAMTHRYNEELEVRVADQVKQIADAHVSTIFALSALSESRDPETGAHLERMREYCRLLSVALQSEPAYGNVIDAAFVENIYAASPLHDIGKVGIPDHVLLKPGKLSEGEFIIMQQHCTIGAETLRRVSERYKDNAFINMGIEIAESHHEKWNGAGYPHGTLGEEIPLASRILALCDVYDALTSKRCYKEAFSHEKSRDIILSERGKHFDPIITDVFERIQDEFDAIRMRLQEEDRPPAAL